MYDITVEELVKLNNKILIDVRSPEEFREGAIPGAINIPLLDDIERKEIGTIYKQVSQDAAKWRAMEIVAPKIPSLLSQVKETKGNKATPVIYCWRGGMRSKSMATFLEFAGVPIARLQGGYKAYREYTLASIPIILPEKAIVLHGMTGVGKTEVLKKLHEKGIPVLDLESLANHKGSIFGEIGMNQSHNQKTFDALLYSALDNLIESPYFVMEAESKRIGKVTQPEELLTRKINGVHFLLTSSISYRVNRIYEEYVKPFYQSEKYHEEVSEKLLIIQKRLKEHKVTTEVLEQFNKRNYKALIRILLEHYYDPRYQHKQDEYNGTFYTVNTDNLEDAVNQIIKQIRFLYPLQVDRKANREKALK